MQPISDQDMNAMLAEESRVSNRVPGSRIAELLIGKVLLEKKINDE